MEDRRFKFFHPLQVRYADNDPQGQVFFANYFTFFDEASGGYWRAIGFPWQRLVELGLDIFYVDAHCQYRDSARFEELLHVHARMARIGNSSMTMEFAAYRPADDALICTGEITAVVVDPQSRQPTRVPDELRQAVAAFEGETE